MAGIGPTVIEIDEDDSDAEAPGSSKVWTEDLLRFFENERLGPGLRSEGEPAGAAVIEIDGSSEDGEQGDAMESDDEVQLVSVSALDDNGFGRKPPEEMDGGLGCLSPEKAKEMIESASSRLRFSLDSLKLIPGDGRGSMNDSRHAGISTACSVPNSSNLMNIEQEKLWLLRLLFQIKQQWPSLLTPEQMREMDTVMQTMLSAAVHKEQGENCGRRYVVNKIATIEGEAPNSNCLEQIAASPVDLHSSEGGMAKLEQPIMSSERVAPLANPTTSRNLEDQDPVLPPHDMDAAKTVSSHQQRCGQTSSLSTNRLLSLSPYGECHGDDDPYGEYSISSSAEGDDRTRRSGSVLKDVGANRNLPCSNGFKATTSRMTRLDRRVLGKNMDPRFRFLKVLKNGIIMGPSISIKRKSTDQIEVNDHILNTQRNRCTTNTGFIATQSNSRICVNENVKLNTTRPANGETCSGKAQDARTNYNSITGELKQILAKSRSLATALCSSLEDVSANPRQGIAAEAQHRTTELGKNQVKTPQLPAQTASMSDAGIVCINPCGLHHTFHDNVAQKSEDLGSEQIRSSESLPLGTQATPPCITKPKPNMTDKVDVLPAARDLNDQKYIPESICGGGVGDASPSSNPWGDVDHLLDGFNDQQKAAIHIERVRRIDEQNKMFSAGKLCLVLDLDHTLLNSVKFEEVDPVHVEALRKREEEDQEKPQRHLYRFLHLGMWTKLRPGIWNFLHKAGKLYELHIYTMGNKLYATEMAKVLDPTGVLFSGRIIARGECGDCPCPDGDERVPKSKDLDGVLGMESAVVIIDDTARVWPHHKPNLITVERYTYFPCSRRQFGLLGPSLLEIDRDERAADGTLASALEVIERIHREFFAHPSLCEADVRKILVSEQRKVLAGCHIVFSRVFPIHEENPQLHPLWRTAEQFGAICSNRMDEGITHVVATSLGTDKVKWALSTNRFVVRPSWVEASALLYRRADEHQFAIKSKSKKWHRSK